MMKKATKSAAMFSRCTAIMLLVLCAAPAWPLGILVPRQQEFSPIHLGEAEVRAEVTNNVAKTRVIQEFFNPNSRQLEADFYFPVPKDANVTDFVLYMNGKPVKGEVLEKEKAREIYEGIVRRMQDPGLLEWIDYNLFKVRVFPVPPNGTQKIELEFAQPLQADQGVYKYSFPMKTPKGALEAGRRENPKVKFTVDIKSDEPLRNIYSPSHTVETDQRDPKSVKVVLPPTSLAGGGDFVLFYEVSSKDVALSLVTTRPGSDDGYFCLMLSPQLKADDSQVTPNDLAFVLDTSGSMLEGNKIEQARRALSYCVSQLRDKDRFAVIRFSTEVEKYKDTLQDATKENIEAAKQWIGSLPARGGTNISGALEQALAMAPPKGESGRVYTVVFITDGMPTVGETNADRIVSQIKPGTHGSIRIFTFGVGNDVNAKLLDRVADETRAVSEYIKPSQDMEVPISKFFDKISRPAMVNLALDMPGGSVYDMYPSPLPDMFYGTQLTVFGRYKKPGPTAIKLTGMVAGKSTEFVYEKTLPEREPSNEFVEKLWGTRKIGYLLDAIRSKGESSEVKDEVIRLAKKYGVVTPYTSYLVAEDVPMGTPRPPVAMAPRPHDTFSFGIAGSSGAPGQPTRMAGRVASRDGMERPQAMAKRSADRLYDTVPHLDAQQGVSRNEVMARPMAESGEAAVRMSQSVRRLKESKSEAESDAAKDVQGVRTAGSRTFQMTADGTWVDTAITGDEKPVLRIKYMSDAYFAALKINPELRTVFALGERIRVKLAHGIVEVGPDGKDKLDPADEKSLAP